MRFLLLFSGWLFTGEAFALCVKAQTANLRTGPSTKYSISWVVGKHTPLLKLKRKGSWYRVKDVDGQIHWVHRSLVVDHSRCVSVRVNTTNLRSGPGVEFKKNELMTADKYTSYRSLGGEDGWIQVQDEFGGKYYVSLKNVWRPVVYRRIGL